MTVETALELGRTAILLSLIIGSPVLIVAAAVGLVISILQALTQVQDQTVSQVPKLIAMFLVTLFVLPWMINKMVEYSVDLIRDIPSTL